MIRLILLALLVLPTSLAAQSATLRVEGVGEPARAEVARHHGSPAYPASALRPLGARLRATARGGRVLLFGDTLRFRETSPFFSAAGRVRQLVAPVYRKDGVLYLPQQFFTEWLPHRYPERVAYAGGVLRLTERGRRVATRASPRRAAGVRPAPAPERVVTIDPGHGGRDPGRIGPNGLREKDVVLLISKRLAELLREDGYEVHLTRTTDTLIALADRPRMANEWKAGRPASLFLSIHANAHSSDARGFETFFLSEARTDDERRVAEMENAAVRYERRRGGEVSDVRGYILNNLRNDFYMHASNDLAALIQQEFARFHPGPNRGVKQAGFRVLVGAFMPAVLVETAFLSHPKGARLLATPSFQQKLAEAIATAVDRFFDTHEYLVAPGGRTARRSGPQRER